MIEVSGDQAIVRKRPGISDGGLIRAGIAQLLYYWNGIKAIIGDYYCVISGTTVTTTWTYQATNMPASTVWQCVAYGGGRYVAVGNSGATAYSTDGVTWVAGASLTAQTWASIAWNGTVFCVKTITGTTRTATSTDGSTWNEGTGRLASANYGAIASDGNGLFVSPLQSGNNVSTSTDGITWTVQAGVLPSSVAWTFICHNGTVFCTVPNSASSATAVSADGLTWTSVTRPDTNARINVVANTGVICAVPSGVSAPVAHVSTDNGLTWTSGTAMGISSSSIYGAAAVGGVFFAWNINAGQTTSLSLSYDGLAWNNVSRSPAVLNLIYCAASNGTFTTILGGANFGANTQDNGYSTAMVLAPTSTNTALSPTNASLQFTASDTGANAGTARLMFKNATQGWTVTPSGSPTLISDTDYPGAYSVTATSLTRSGTVATFTSASDINLRVGDSVTIAGATPSAYNGAQTVTGITRQSTIVNPSVTIAITRVSTTATASSGATPHGFTNGQSVTIAGANQSEYNGTFTIAWISATSFSFTVSVTTTTSSGTTPTAVASPASVVGTLSAMTLYVSSYTNVGTSGATDVQLTVSTYGPAAAVGTSLVLTAAIEVIPAGTYAVTAVTTASANSSTAGWRTQTINITVAGLTGNYPNSPLNGGYKTTAYFTPVAISSITNASGLATATTSTAHNLATGSSVTILGCTPSDYNGGYSVTVTGSTTFTYLLGSSSTPTTTTTTSPATPATGTILATSAATGTGSSFTFTIAGSPATPATGTITASIVKSTVPGIAYMDGYFFVMDNYGVIYNSGIDDPTSWTGLGYITAQNETGAGVALAKSLNYVVAFKEWSTEFFYNAANAIGSPLSPVGNGFTQVGCASGNSLTLVDGSLVWLSQVRQRGRSVHVMQGTEQVKVSTPDVERILNLDSLATVYAYGMKLDGHSIYVLTLVSANITIVYDFQSQTWAQWSTLTIGSSKSVSSITRVGTTATVTTSTAHGIADGAAVKISGATQSDYNGYFQAAYISTTSFSIEVSNSPTTPATGTILAYPYTESYFKYTKYADCNGANDLLHESIGDLYTVSSSVYQDALSPISVLIRTQKLDGGSEVVKTLNRITVIGDEVSSNAMIRWSDDDYQTFSSYRTFSLNKINPQIRRCGTYRRRSIDVRHVANTSLRIESLELGA